MRHSMLKSNVKNNKKENKYNDSDIIRNWNNLNKGTELKVWD